MNDFYENVTNKQAYSERDMELLYVTHESTVWNNDVNKIRQRIKKSDTFTIYAFCL